MRKNSRASGLANSDWATTWPRIWGGNVLATSEMGTGMLGFKLINEGGRLAPANDDDDEEAGGGEGASCFTRTGGVRSRLCGEREREPELENNE